MSCVCWPYNVMSQLLSYPYALKINYAPHSGFMRGEQEDPLPRMPVRKNQPVGYRPVSASIWMRIYRFSVLAVVNLFQFWNHVLWVGNALKPRSAFLNGRHSKC